MEINDDKRFAVCTYMRTCLYTYTLSAEVEHNDRRELPFHPESDHSEPFQSHGEDRNIFCTFSSQGEKKSREFPGQKLVLFLPLKIGFCSWQFLSKPCIPFYLSFSGLTVITGPRLKKMLQFSLGLPRSKEIFSLKSGLVDLLSAALNSTSHCSPR